MMLWKLIDGLLVKAPDNLQDEEALAAGYKPLRWTQCPGDVTLFTDVWSEEETEIVQRWVTVPAGHGADEPATTTMLSLTEDGMTATRNYSIDDLLAVGSTLYVVTAAIPNGSAITPGVNVTPTTLAEQLEAVRGGVTWRLLGEYDIAQLRAADESWNTGAINLSNLGGLTELYFRWDGLGNASNTASSLGNLFINSAQLFASAVPTGKTGQSLHGFLRLRWNGLTWEIGRTPGAIYADNYTATFLQTTYNEPLGVGPCDSISFISVPEIYKPDRGTLKIYGAK